jgi:glycosyltransferase involved in cell wall biosynthesis
METAPTELTAPPMRVLVMILGSLGDRLTGPEIRGLEIARAFAQRHEVTAIAKVTEETSRDGLRVVPLSRRNLLRELDRNDVVIGAVIPPYAMVAGGDILRVADLYDPVALELATVGGRRGARLARQRNRINDLHLRAADLVVGANERQVGRIQAELEALTGPSDREVLTVPMGLPTAPAQTVGHPLRDRFPEIGPQDPLVLWWGSVWRWLDATTAVEAIGLLAERRPDIRMVITAGRPPNAATDPLNVTEDVRRVARERGLLDRHVFFLDEWVPFDDRHSYLADATLGITLHADTAEAPLAARARYMDCVWASLPLVLARGDEVAERLAEAGAAILVPPHDAAATADAIEALLADPTRLDSARQACRRVAEEFEWPTLLAPLVDAVERAVSNGSRRDVQSLRVATDAGRYYLGQALDRVLLRS